MITFKEYITEARSAPLYHATPIENAENILGYGFQGRTEQLLFKSKGQASWARPGVSFTREMQAAKLFMRNSLLNLYYVIFEIDQEKLRHHFKMVPTDYFGTQDAIYGDDPRNKSSRRKESEEFVPLKKTWSDSEQKYIPGGITPGVIKAVHYYDLKGYTPSNKLYGYKIATATPTTGENYMLQIEHLKKKYPRYKWVEMKP